MARTPSYNFSEYYPNKAERDKLVLALITNRNRLVYKKLKRNYKTYCFTCNEYKTVTPDEMKQIKASNLCPVCHNFVNTGVKLHEDVYGYVAMRKDDKDFGYLVIGSWDFGKKPKANKIEQVMVKEDGVDYRHNIVKGMGYHLCRTQTDGWRKCTSDYWGFFQDIDKKYSYGYREPKTKREYYDIKLEDIKHLLKSNQKKVLMDNLMNANQVAYMIAFNLNTIEQVLKYSSYMKKYDITFRPENLDRNLNEYYLKYLSKNKIRVRDFFDYIDQCKLLDVKLDKPKDFYKKHAEYSEIIEIKENEVHDKVIGKLSKTLTNYAYNGPKYTIKPFINVEEIIKAGKDLHNCIATYIERYAKQRTTLWYLSVGQEVQVAIEVRSGILLQARTDYNMQCTKEQERIIKKWLKQNNWVWRNED